MSGLVIFIVVVTVAIVLLPAYVLVTERHLARPSIDRSYAAKMIVLTLLVGGWIAFFTHSCQQDETRIAQHGAAETSSPTVATCDQEYAKNVLRVFRDNNTIYDTDGWTVYRFGANQDPTAGWHGAPVSARGRVVRQLADADACVHQRARRLEFQSPSGEVVARADEVRGIQIAHD